MSEQEQFPYGETRQVNKRRKAQGDHYRCQVQVPKIEFAVCHNWLTHWNKNLAAATRDKRAGEIIADYLGVVRGLVATNPKAKKSLGDFVHSDEHVDPKMRREALAMLRCHEIYI